MTGIAIGSAALTGVALGWWGVVAVVVGMVATILLTGKRVVVQGALAIAAVACVGAWRAETAAPTPLPHPSMTPSSWSGTIVSLPIHDGQWQHFVIAPEDTAYSDRHSGRLCVVAGALPPVQLGDRVEFAGAIESARDASQRGRRYLQSQGCGASIFSTWHEITAREGSFWQSLASVREQIGRSLRESAPGDAGVLLSGLVTGDDERFSDNRREAFRRSGTTHLTAVSGSNLALVVGLLAAVGSVTVGRHYGAWRLMTIGAVWAYALLSGSQPPAVRAAIVAMAAILAFAVGRRPDFVTLIILAAGAMVLIEPAQVERLGFRLSVAASLALAVVLSTLFERHRTNGIVLLLAATTAAQLATLPLLLPSFGAISLASIPANILVAPLVTLAMPLAAASGLIGLAFPAIAELLAVPAVLLATLTLQIVDILGAPSAWLEIGVPPLESAMVFGATATGLLLILGGQVDRWLETFSRAMVKGHGEHRMTSGHETADERVAGSAAAAAAVLGREDPTHTLAADADDSIDEPASKKERHQVAENR